MAQANQTDSHQMLKLLKWYQSSGISLAVGDGPVDQFALSAKLALVETASDASKNAPVPEPVVPKTAQAPVEATLGDPTISLAKAQAANTLDELRIGLETLEGCALRIRASHTVFASGNPEAEIMLIGKAPSREDDMQGEAFCGPAGQLLDNMLGAIGLDRTNVYMANIVPWRPPGNRDPSPNEIEMCLPFLKRQMEIVAPKFVMVFGEMATRCFLGENARLQNLRGQWQSIPIGEHKAQIMPSLHPEFLLKQPAQKHQSWADLLQFRKVLDEQCPTS